MSAPAQRILRSRRIRRRMRMGLDERMRRFCAYCGDEYSLELTRCPQCGEKQPEEDFEAALIRALRHPIPDSAAIAAYVLGKRRCVAAVPTLVEASRSAEPQRSEAALAALAMFDEPAAVERLREASTGGTARMRAIAIAGLRRKTRNVDGKRHG